MSYTELHLGKLRKIDLNGMDIETYCKEECERHGYEYGKYTDSWYSALRDGIARKNFKDNKGYISKIVKVNGELYEIIDDTEFPDNDFISYIINNGDGTYTYLMSFYNGGTCLDEMLEYAITEIKNN
nr:unnamed protein product [uncultured bacterium]